jgi:molecular chaperone DnaJ
MDHYTFMGVARTATSDEIQKAYRKLAKTYHPDRNPGDKEAEANFKLLSAAYEVLSDPTKRAEYDRQGHVGRRPQAPPKPEPPKEEPSKPKTDEDFRKERTDSERRKNPTPDDLAQIRVDYFGGAGTGRNIQVQLKLSPAEMKKGGKHEVLVKNRDFCGRCVGDGKSLISCPACNGHRPDVGYCPKCDGMGAEYKQCTTCGGSGLGKWIIKSVTVYVSPNVQPGHSIKILGEGEHAPFKAPGHLRVVVVPK